MDEPSSTEAGAITLRIKFKSESLDDFVAKYGADVSAGGIFIRTKQPLAVGTLLNFEFSLADSSLLMSGLGTVVWLREPDPARPSSVPGMGLRFDQLSPEGQGVHQQLLAQKARRDGRSGAPPKSGAGANKESTRAGASPLSTTTPPAPAVTAASADTMGALEEFDAGGKTEIANHPPSYFFEAAEKARAAAETAPDAAAPRAPLENWQTDAQGLDPPTVAANSLDLAWMGQAQGEPPSPDSPMAPMEDVLMQTGETQTEPPKPSHPLPHAALLDLPLGDEGTPSLPDSGAFSESVPTQPLTLDSSAIEAIHGGPDEAVPVEAPDEKTDQVASAHEEMPIERTDGTAGDVGAPSQTRDDMAAAPAEADVEAEAVSAGAGALVDKPKRSQGRVLVLVGLLAAVGAFAGVYLMQAKPWRTAGETSSPSAPASGTPALAPAPAQRVEAVAPPAEPVPAPAAAKPAATEPAISTETKPAAAIEAKPASAAASEQAKLAAAKSPASAPKPVVAAETPPVARPLAGKKAAAKSPEPGPAPIGEVKYILKVRSIPPGGDVLIDGERMGPTPFQRRILDTSKPHTVVIRRPGYEPYERTISASDSWIVKGEEAVLTVSAKLAKIKVEEPAVPSDPTPASDPNEPGKI